MCCRPHSEGCSHSRGQYSENLSLVNKNLKWKKKNLGKEFRKILCYWSLQFLPGEVRGDKVPWIRKFISLHLTLLHCTKRSGNEPYASIKWLAQIWLLTEGFLQQTLCLHIVRVLSMPRWRIISAKDHFFFIFLSHLYSVICLMLKVALQWNCDKMILKERKKDTRYKKLN